MQPLEMKESGLFADSVLVARWLRLKCALSSVLGWLLERTKAPAKLRAFEFVNPDSDETVYLYTSTRYSVLCIGERRLYFDRITGKLDGFSAPASAVATGIEFRD